MQSELMLIKNLTYNSHITRIQLTNKIAIIFIQLNIPNQYFLYC